MFRVRPFRVDLLPVNADLSFQSARLRGCRRNGVPDLLDPALQRRNILCEIFIAGLQLRLLLFSIVRVCLQDLLPRSELREVFPGKHLLP